jgi:aminoglycoside phosphotransferase family enzyme/predicted kinase
MTTDDQREVIAFLGSPASHDGRAVEQVETHASVVFLVGTRALKLKRAVKYDYLDFSTAERRRASCEAEVRLNRRTAPSLYRGVVPVTREADGSLALGGGGAAVDWVVDMRRFDQDQLFDRLAQRGQLDRALMRPLAEEIARFHAAADIRPDRGGRANMAWVVDGNERSFRDGQTCLNRDTADAVTRAARESIERHGDDLDRRRREGLVRQCHGDLHLRNIVRLDGIPTLFDGVEFNDDIACIDVFYDLAFLLMDLWRHDLREHAHLVLNAYLAAGHGAEVLSLLPLFLSCRAAVRAKTSATAAGLQRAAEAGRELRDLAARYLLLAQRLLAPPPPLLVAIGGLSGSGKSTLAFRLGPWLGATPGALVVRTDEVRKQMSGVPFLTRLGPEHYAAELTAPVYETSIGRAVTAAKAGHASIVDGVFARAEERDAVADAARTAGVPFLGLWLDAPGDVLIERAQGRLADASDADAAVVRAQLARGTGTVSWAHVGAAGAPGDVLDAARALVTAHAPNTLNVQR